MLSNTDRVNYISKQLKFVLNRFQVWEFVTGATERMKLELNYGLRGDSTEIYLVLCSALTSAPSYTYLDDLLFETSKFNSNIADVMHRLDICCSPEDGYAENQSVKLAGILRNNSRFECVIALRPTDTYVALDNNIKLVVYRALPDALVVKPAWGRSWTIRHNLNTPIQDLRILVDADGPLTEPYAAYNDPLNQIILDSPMMDSTSGGVAVQRKSHSTLTDTQLLNRIRDCVEARRQELQRKREAEELAKPKPKNSISPAMEHMLEKILERRRSHD